MEALGWRRQTIFLLFGCKFTDSETHPTNCLVQLLQKMVRLPKKLTTNRVDFLHGAKSRSSNFEKSEDRESLYLPHSASGQRESHKRDLKRTEDGLNKEISWPVNSKQTITEIRLCTQPSVSREAARLALSLTTSIIS